MINNADKQYQDLLRRILEKGKAKGDRTGTGTISIPFATLEFDMSEGFPLLTTKKVFTKAIVHELLWFINGDTNIKYLEDNGVTIWTSDAYREYNKKVDGLTEERLTKENFSMAIKQNPKFAEMYGELGPVYGRQWRNWTYPYFEQYIGEDKKPKIRMTTKGIDQLAEAMNKLLNNPDDRRILVSAWNVAEIPHMALPPCHWAFELYTEELDPEERWAFAGIKPNMSELEWANKFCEDNNVPKRRLHLKWHQRSVDTFLGLPFNIASYGILLCILAQQANMVPGTLVGDLTNVHIYNNHIEQCKEQISREPRELPSLLLNKAQDLFSYKYSDIGFENYHPHDAIKGDISV